MGLSYEVKAPLWAKLLAVSVFAVFLGLLVLDDTFSVITQLRYGSLIENVAMLAFLIGFPFLLLIILFTKTVFTERQIIHTNFFLKKTKRRYDEITSLEITKRSDLRLYFRDGTSFKVLTGRWYLSKTLMVLKNHREIDLMFADR
jgi:hypothetical protein